MTSQYPRTSDRDLTDAWPQGDALDGALSTILQPPALPADFHVALRRAIELETERDTLARRRAMEADHAQRLAELRAGYVRVRRDALAIALAISFTLGAGISVALPWLVSAIGNDIPALAPVLAALVGIGAAVLVVRLGSVRWGGTSPQIPW